jgi:hypothetical protein
VGAGVTDDEKLDIAERLLRMQSMLRDVCDACRQHGELCKALDEPALAFASFMVGESIASFSREVVRYTETALDS